MKDLERDFMILTSNESTLLINLTTDKMKTYFTLYDDL